MVENSQAFVANVGDSRVYLQRGSIIEQKTNDHSLVNEQIQAGLISEEDAKNHKLKNIITRSVGYQEEVEIDIAKFALEKGDKLILCSDGLTNLVDDAQIYETISQNDIKASCQKLVDLANENGGDDNITVVICEIKD